MTGCAQLEGEKMKRNLMMIVIAAMAALESVAQTAVAENAMQTASMMTTVMTTTRPMPKLPPIDGWLIHGNGTYANWLGIKYFGKTLREPINVVIVDPYATSPKQATDRLVAECEKAGYGVEYGHSSGYSGIIDGVSYPQVPHKKHVAFANHDFFRTNNHGRIMGPAPYAGGYIFVAAFSEERPAFAGSKLEHVFVSFNAARDDFSRKMNTRTRYRVVGAYALGNMLASQTETTADHDGDAIVLVADSL